MKYISRSRLIIYLAGITIIAIPRYTHKNIEECLCTPHPIDTTTHISDIYERNSTAKIRSDMLLKEVEEQNIKLQRQYDSIHKRLKMPDSLP